MNSDSNEHERHVNHLGSFLAGALVGSLAGTVTVLLLAPQSGERTRTQIQQGGIDLKNQMTGAVDDAVSQTRAKARQITADVREKATAIQHGGQEMLADQAARVSAAVAAGKTAYQGPQD